jgi:phosphatidylglycerophosphatase A
MLRACPPSPLSSVVLWLGTCGKTGFWGKCPGTLGALWGTLVYPFTFGNLSAGAFAVGYAILLFLTVWICGKCEKILGTTDPAAVNLDEFTAMPLCFWPVQSIFSHSMGGRGLFLGLGFLLFRYFDIAKPLFIRRLQNLPGGWGITIDDSAAALLSALCLAIGAGLVSAISGFTSG